MTWNPGTDLYLQCMRPFQGRKKYIKNLDVSPTWIPTGLMFQQTSLSEQLISCLSARIIQNYQRPLLLPVPGFPSLNIGLDTAINEAKIAHGAMKTAVMELWWKGWGIQLGRLGKDWKGLDNGNIARLAKGPGINGRTQGTRLRTGMPRMGRSLRLKRLSKKDRGRWTLALPPRLLAMRNRAWRRWSMLRTSATLPPLACPAPCQDDGSCEQWMCLLY